MPSRLVFDREDLLDLTDQVDHVRELLSGLHELERTSEGISPPEVADLAVARALCALAVEAETELSYGGKLRRMARKEGINYDRCYRLVKWIERGGPFSFVTNMRQCALGEAGESLWHVEYDEEGQVFVIENPEGAEDYVAATPPEEISRETEAEPEEEEDPFAWVGEELAGMAGEDEEAINALEFVTNKNYHFKSAGEGEDGKGFYRFYLNSVGEMFEMPKSVWDLILRMYSNYGEGTTIREAGNRIGLHKKAMQELLHEVMEITHDSLPLSQEDVENEEREVLHQRMLNMKEAQLKRDQEKLERRQVEKDAKAYREIEYHWGKHLDRVVGGLEEYIPQLKETAKEMERPAPDQFNFFVPGEWEGIFSPSDIHYGKYAWADETGRGYDRQTCEERLFGKTEILAADLARHPIKRLYVPVGNDWFNIDTSQATTSSGRTTPDSDGTPDQIMTEGQFMAARMIEHLKKLFPGVEIVLVLVKGNHDKLLSSATINFLYAYFRGDDRVTVSLNKRKLQHLKIGKSVVSLTHGEGLVESKSKRTRLALRIMNETSKWGDDVHWHYCFNGHLHHLRQYDVGGVIMRQFMSLGGDDRWHAEKGFVGSLSGLAGCAIHPEAGIRGEYYAPVLPGEEQKVSEKMALGEHANDLENAALDMELAA